jgi:ABC-type branched-subunit amino acid transport system substrate-binding protein
MSKGLVSKNGLRTFGLVAAVFLLLSWMQVQPGTAPAGSQGGGSTELGAGDLVDDTGEPVTAEEEAAGESGTAGGGPGAAAGSAGATGSSGGGPAAASGLECKAGKNGGTTDTGVTGSTIKVATTAVLDGAAKSLLSDSVIGMKAVVDKVNQAGGICGRLIDLRVVNDSFSENDGLRILRNFMEEGYFALPVVPSAEGLGAAILGGWVTRGKIPVIGTDGMRQEQYTDPLVWPVASATVTAMRVMAKYGWEKKGARSFGIVWDEKYKFGKEGKDAFVKQVEAMGGTVVADRPLDPDKSSYASEADDFNSKCGNNKCDMVAMLLLPDAAAKWMVRQPAIGKLYTAGAQTLFTNAFAERCVQAAKLVCNGIAVWTGYNPPVGAAAAKPGVAAYINDVRALSPGIDVNNQFLEGAYLGMNVFVEALKRVGPALTRARLKEVMDSMTYTSDITSTLKWSPGNHAANVRSQAYSMVVSQGVFTGWRDDNTGFLLDPAHGG